MKTISITDFKAQALQILAQVAKTKESIVVTKRGVPLTKVIPFTNTKPTAGKLSKALVFEKDILSPLGEDLWDACK